MTIHGNRKRKLTKVQTETLQHILKEFEANSLSDDNNMRKIGNELHAFLEREGFKKGGGSN